jgi:hypothetical protein
MNIVDRIKKSVTGLIISSGDTVFQNILLKEINKGLEEEEEDVSVCWITLR